MNETEKLVQVTELDDSSIWQITLDSAKGNILDINLIEQLRRIFAKAPEAPHLKAIILAANGEHFSYGASIEEHLKPIVANLLYRFHQLIDSMIDAAPYLIAAVQGCCLGGGLELILPATSIVAHKDSTFGQPEIELGVFAPIASVLLPLRVGQFKAEQLLLTGKHIGANEALAMGLIDEIVDDPQQSALDFVREHLAKKSASSLRFAMQATREKLKATFSEEIKTAEALYLKKLMASHDATEGIEAFLYKRMPEWRNC